MSRTNSKEAAMKRLISTLALAAAACTPSDPQGYVTLSLPTHAQMARLAAADAPAAAPQVGDWVITVTAADMAEPIVVTTGEATVTIPVKAGPERIVHVAARAPEAAGVTQGFDGETKVDVAAEGDTAADVDVYRSVTVKDANGPVSRIGQAADASAPDVDEITMTLGADGLLVFVTFLNDVAAPWNSTQANSLRGLIEFDTDRNAQTGDVSLVQLRRRALSGDGEDKLLGVEFALDLTPVQEGYVKLLTGETSKPVAANFGARTLSLNLPWATLGGRFVDMRFAALLSNKAGALDFVPETGYVEVARATAPKPSTALQAVSSFAGNFITTIESTRFVQPSLAATPTGFKAAWYDDAGFLVASSDSGDVFSTPMRGTVDQNNAPAAVDIAADESGNTFLAVTTFDSLSYSAYASVLQITQSFTGVAKGGTAMSWSPGYSRPAEIAAKGGVAFATGPYDYMASNVYSYQDGVISKGTSIGGQGVEFTLGVGGDNLLVGTVRTVCGAADCAVTAGLQTVPAVAPLATFGAAVDAGAANMPGGPAYFALASNGPQSYMLMVVQNASFEDDIYVVDMAAKTGVAFAAGAAVDILARAADFSGAEGTSYPQIAVSKSGRVGVVWHSSGSTAMMAAPSLAGSFITVGTHAIYYAELLPGATAFSAPLRIGEGRTAALAFDANERPVVLVAKADAAQGGAPTSNQLYVYRGQ
jgi:hypothetical protein